ncbi:MAG: response regulator [Cyanobacteria bacterium P01_A01_bin.114]
MLPEQQQRIMGYFIEEAKDNLNTIERGLLNLQATIEDPEMANEVFRAAHSVKGGAAMLGIESVQRTAHRMEDYFKILKESPVKTDRDLESMFLQVFDAMQELVEQLQGPFGLTDDKAQEIMTGVDPVFDRLNDHLETLVQTASIEQPAPQPAAISARQQPVIYEEDSALQLVFKSDVSGCLREMLTLFRQDDNDRSRGELQSICQRLKQLGEQFELAAWNDLIETARLAIANHSQDYRALAPVLIKDIKKAQDLVLANRAPEVAVSEAMQNLLPEDAVADSMLESASAEFDDLFADAPAPSEDDLFAADLFGSAPGTAEGTSEVDLASDLFGDAEPTSVESFDLNLEGIESVSGLESSPPTPDESLDFLLDNTAMGPEVGDAELNSLADLFEGDLSDLDDVWQDEEVRADVGDLSSSPVDVDITDDDFADLLESSSDFAGVGESDSPASEIASEIDSEIDSEMTALFGDMLSEEAGSLESAGLDSLDSGSLDLDSIDLDSVDLGSTNSNADGLDPTRSQFGEGTQLDDALNELADSEFPGDGQGDEQGLLSDLAPELSSPGASQNASDSNLELDSEGGAPFSLDDILDDIDVSPAEVSSSVSDTEEFEFEFSPSDAVTKIEPDTPLGDLDFGGDAAADLETLSSDDLSGDDLDFGLGGNTTGETTIEASLSELGLGDELDLDFERDVSLDASANVDSPGLEDLGSELDLDFDGDTSDAPAASFDELALDFGSDISNAPAASFDELDLDFGSDASNAPAAAAAVEGLSDEFALDLGGDVPESFDADAEGLGDELDLDFGASTVEPETPDLSADLDASTADGESAEALSAVGDDFFNDLPAADASDTASTSNASPDSDEIESFFETPESSEALLPSPSELDVDLTQDPWDDSVNSEASALADFADTFDDNAAGPTIAADSSTDDLFDELGENTAEASSSEDLSALDDLSTLDLDVLDLDASGPDTPDLADSLDLDMSNLDGLTSDGADSVFSDLPVDGAEGIDEATFDDLSGDSLPELSPLAASSTDEVQTDLAADLPDGLFSDSPDALEIESFDLDFSQAGSSERTDEASSDSLDSVGDGLAEDLSLPDLSDLPDINPAGEVLTFSALEVLETPEIELDPPDDSNLDGPDSLDDLDALLDEGAVLEDSLLEEDDLSGGGTESVSDVAGATSGDNEFQDLERLLEEADQTLGGPTGASVTRRISPSANRLSSRRSSGILGEQTMRVSVNHLDNLSNLVGELVVNRNTLEQDQERLRQFLDNLLFQVQQLNDVGQRMRDLYERSLLESSLISSRQVYSSTSAGGAAIANPDDHATGETFDALEMDRFTGFHTLSQEMIELIVRVRESSSDIGYTVDSTDQVTRQFRQVTTQLQEGLNKARMVPFAQTADRLPRAVRDISLKCGKESGLVVEGRDTLIDKMILEQLYNPMTHLVNNAITHGVETPEQRLAAGKSREGTITVRAFYQGNQTVIYVADDGGGIDPDLVKRKAVEKGLITQAEAKSMSVLDVYELLFHPGFSTRDQADDFAGRGVGMDVVRTSLAEIRGSITIDSELGKGTSFTIRLPLTLSISKALSCISNQARIAFPMDGVEDMLDVPKDRIRTNDQGEQCILWRDTMLPFQKLSDLLKFNRTLGRGRVYGGQVDEDVISIVVLRSASSYIALEVDQVIGEQEIVIKQLEGPVPKPVGIAGATVLGDGRVMPIADVLELIDIAMGRVRREPTTAVWGQPETPVVEEPAATKSEPTVLIVDDSITVRELLSMSFNKVGYRVEQARDGQEAWEKLKSGLPCSLVFCDIEMPRMDGLELLSRMQKDTALKSIPIAMLTSRGADRHRQMAVDLGASGYFTKPYLEEALLDAANKMLNGESIG